MPPSEWIDKRLEDEIDPALFDDITNLYIGQIAEAKGTIKTDAEQLDVVLFGEVLFYGRVDGDRLIVERLRRFALYGAPLGDHPARIGVISLAGPLVEAKLERGARGAAGDVLLQLHYAALSTERSPLSESDDARFPAMERIVGGLTWEPEGQASDVRANLVISFTANDVVDQQVGLVRAVVLDPIQVVFQLAGTGEPQKAPHYSLPNNCDPPPIGAWPPQLVTVTRTLGLRFVNLSLQIADVEDICRRQIRNACQIWRNEGACQLQIDVVTPPEVPIPGLFEASLAQKRRFRRLSELQDLDLPTLGFDHVNYAEVYLVNEILGRGGGGISYNCGQASAFCILDLHKARQNPFLLAHELGHVLGLAHLDGLGGIMPSSAGSVMEAGIPNPPVNTLFNCQVLTARPNLAGSQPLALNPIVSNTTTSDSFRPDRLV